MACRKGDLREDGRNRNNGAAAPPSFAVGDALLFATMCIIGMPVDVHAKDGSVYSGIFHTASVDKDYAIVLKKARMIKKGNLDANVMNGALTDTLIVQSEDLVQVIAKGVLLPSNGVTGHIGGDVIEPAAGYIECLESDAKVLKLDVPKGNKKQKSQSRFSGKRDKGFPYSSTDKTESLLCRSPEDSVERFVKIEEAHNVSVDGRQAADGSQEMQSDCANNPEFQDKRTTAEVQGSSLSKDTIPQEPKGVSSGHSSALEEPGQDRTTSNETASTVAPPPNVSVASVPIIDIKSDSRLRASSNPFLFVPPKSSSVKTTVKESKLNPGAKVFSPSMPHHRTVSPPAAPNGASVAYMPGNYTMAPMATAQEEVDSNSFAHSSMPVKLVPYNNVAFEHRGNEAQYGQPIIGQVVNRTQPVRYTGVYQNFQTAPPYIHSNPQNAMFGRGPLICMHPISNDVVQSVAGFSQASTTRPLFSPHQVHLSKHQGNASAQALQMCMTPPIVANGPQSFLMTNSIPISQPLFPILRPIAVPGSNGFLSTKFA